MTKTKRTITIALAGTAVVGGLITAPQLLNTNQSTPPTQAMAKTKPSGAKPSGTSAPGQTSSSSAKLSGQTTISGKKVLNKKTITANTANRSAVYVKNGGKLTLTASQLTKSGGTTNTDNSNFFGQNAGLLVTKGGQATISGLTEKTTATGANGIFATGKNARVTVKNSQISTTKSSSRGLDATYTGKITATNTNITTKGSHSAALATDRGGGTVSLNKGTLKTAGDGSPIIYSTGAISAQNVTGTATGAEAADIEGSNSITLKNSQLTGKKNNGVMLYQSMSGDSEVGTSIFSMTNGSLTSTVKSGSKGTTNHTGALFYVTNTTAKINLNNVKLSNASSTLIRLANDRWGTSGSNGGKLTFTAKNQTLKGNILVAKGSTLKLSLTSGSVLTGAINSANTSGKTTIILKGNNTWNVTKDSYVSSLISTKSSLTHIKSNGHNVYYSKSNSANKWLNGKTYTLNGGGKLIAK
ncbi:adhesin [Levilactobacillus sp. N40-8-2]|uniref:adhesin n=1 Tax=Levilactobacillus muriae TaxID=3238987 RepID=UPI0038B4113C